MSAQSRRRALRAAAPVAGLLAAGLLVWQGSYAAFTASTNNTGNTWTAGSVALDNSVNGGNAFSGTTSAIFNATSMKPGDSGTKCITVRSSGNLAGAVKLYLQNESTTKALDANLTLKVEQMTGLASATTVAPDCTGFSGGSTIINSVKLSTAASNYSNYASGVGSWTAGTTTSYAAYRFTWTLDSGAPSTVMGGTAQTDFQWEIQSS